LGGAPAVRRVYAGAAIAATRRSRFFISRERHPMSLSMYQASVPPFLQMLASLSAILDKAEAHAAARKIEPGVLLATRLTPDMFPLVRQVQLAADFAKGGAGRLAGVELPKNPDTETSFAELKARIAKTVDFVNSLKPAQIDGSEGREVTIPVGGQPQKFTGQNYLVKFALPNFYFHVTTAYAILRQCGVEIGKRDYLGQFTG
jgi:hypothetical protein